MEKLVSEKPLTLAEQGRLKKLEGVIRENFRAYVAVGNALLEIRESRLYRNEAGRTWESYCREMWEMAHQHADRLVSAAKVIDNLTPIGVKKDGSPNWDLLPANEAQARELARLAPEEQREVWLHLVDRQQAAANKTQPLKLTARAVKNTVKHFRGEQIRQRVGEASKKVGTHSKDGDRKSEQFRAAFDQLMTEVNREAAAGWRHTPRQAVFEAILFLAQAVGESGAETAKSRKIIWRGNNLEKLLAAGLAIFRLSADKLLIEQLVAGDQWLVAGEYETPEQGLAAFEELMIEPANLQA